MARTNFLKLFEIYTEELEAPDTYHLWVALSILASATRRNIWLNQGVYLLFPNLFVVLVAPPGKLGKSTCIRHGRKILNSVPDIIMGPDAVTAEDLVRRMARAGKDKTVSAVTLHSTEMSSLIDPSGLKMIQFLTDLYDCEDNPHGWRRSTKTAGRDTIHNPVLNMLAGTTPNWIAESLPIQATSHGFTSRTIFIYEDEPRFANPRPKAPSPKLVEELKADLESISVIEGPFEWDRPGQDLYDKYYEQWMTNPPEDFRIEGYYNRKRTHVLKIAMLLHLAEGDDLILTEQDIDAAVRILNMIEDLMPKTFSGVGKFEHTADLDRIWTQIRKSGGMELSRIFRKNYMVGTSEDVYKLVRTLFEMRRVTIVKRGPEGEQERWVVPVSDAQYLGQPEVPHKPEDQQEPEGTQDSEESPDRTSSD